MKRFAILAGVIVSGTLLTLHAQSITNYAFSYSTGSFNSIVGQTGTQTASLISGSTR